MEQIKIKGLTGAIVGVFGYLYGCISGVLIVLGILMVIDYPLGVASSWFNDEKFDKKKAVKGLVKKLSYMALILLAFLLDYSISSVGSSVVSNVTTNGALGIATILYMIGTESFSILKNLGRLGVPVPNFLQTAVESMTENIDKTEVKSDG